MPRKNLYILGSRGIPAAHGGFETFAQDLSAYMTGQGWRVTVYCQSHANAEDEWHGIRRIHIKAPDTVLGTAWFDLKSILHCLRQPDGIWLTLGYNTGLLNFIPKLFRKKQMINMDGIEWRRGKWSLPYKACFYLNYLCAGWAADVLIADHPAIEEMLKKTFRADKIRMIAYGAHAVGASAQEHFLEAFGVKPNEYGLVIARPEPENSILEIVTAWSAKERGKKLIVLGNYLSMNAYHVQVKNAASAEVIFPGGVYDKPAVKALRAFAWIYLHGHTVGGTNPSLIEAMAAGNTTVAHDNPFNRWVAGNSAYYFKTQSELKTLLNEGNLLPLRSQALARHDKLFEWHNVMGQYKDAIENFKSADFYRSPD